ncbi:NUT family member 2G-like [Camelus dromedarius]|uniref:NUT family member 2G-like n=1 Tax=Camelus dromedarius TaxID=9838 RepID=UPI00311A4B87
MAQSPLSKCPSPVDTDTPGFPGKPQSWLPILLLHSPLSFVSTASPLLGTDVLMSTGASLTPVTALPFPPPTPGPEHWPPWEQHLPPSLTPSFPPGTTLLLPAVPMTPLVATGGQVPMATGPCNITVQLRSEGRPAEPLQMQSFVLTPGTVTWGAPGALSGSATCPAPLSLAPSLATPAVGVTQAAMGGWAPGLPPLAPPPAAQRAPSIPPINAGPRPPGTSREGSLATSQSQPPQVDSCNRKSVYKNYRRWQRFKSLARRHLPQSPDAEALSCFLIPVLRSLARLKPTMTLEEGLRRAEQEWERTSDSDRMMYYAMAAKFKEFEAEEETQLQQLQSMKGVQGLPPPAPPKPEPRGPPAPKVGPQLGTHVPTGAQRKGNRDLGMATVPTSALFPQGGHWSFHLNSHPEGVSAALCHYGVLTWSAVELLSHLPRPRETKAPKEIPLEAVKEYEDILEELLGPVHLATEETDAECPEDGTYPDPGLLSYVDQLCSQEDFVTKVEAVIHPQFLAALLSPEPQLDPLALAEELEEEEGLSPEELVQKRLLALKEELGVQASTTHRAPQLDSSPRQSDVTQDAQRHDEGPQLGVSEEDSPPEMESEELPREDAGPGPEDGSSEEKEEVPSLDFILATQISLSSAPAPAAESRKRDLCGGQGSDDKLPQPTPDLSISGRPALSPELVRPSQPNKRRPWPPPRAPEGLRGFTIGCQGKAARPAPGGGGPVPVLGVSGCRDPGLHPPPSRHSRRPARAGPGSAASNAPARAARPQPRPPARGRRGSEPGVGAGLGVGVAGPTPQLRSPRPGGGPRGRAARGARTLTTPRRGSPRRGSGLLERGLPSNTCPRTASGPAPAAAAAAVLGTKLRGRRSAPASPPGGAAPPPLQPPPLAAGSRGGVARETRRDASRSNRLPPACLTK